MDPNKITTKVAEMVNAARDLAMESSNQQIYPVHLAIVMLEDGEGLAAQAVAKAGGDGAVLAALRTLKKAQVKLPSVSPQPDEVYISSELKKVFQSATKLQKTKGDSFLGEESGGWGVKACAGRPGGRFRGLCLWLGPGVGPEQGRAGLDRHLPCPVRGPAPHHMACWVCCARVWGVRGGGRHVVG